MTTLTLTQARSNITILENVANQLLNSTQNIYSRTPDNSNHYIYENTEEAGSAGAHDYLDQAPDVEEIYEVVFLLRQKVDEANNSLGVSKLLAQEALVKAKINTTKKLINNIGEPKFEPTNNKFSKGLSKEFKSDLNIRINKLNRKAKELADERSLINSKEKISIQTQEVRVLLKHGLIDEPSKN